MNNYAVGQNLAARLATLRHKPPQGVGVAGEGLLFRHSLLRG
ncbi:MULTISPECIES: hypothetical protein [Eikenella]|nr:MULTISPECIES: hypothetical protein [Eikenella]